MIYTWIIALVCSAAHVNLFAFVVESLGTLRVGCLGQEPLDYILGIFTLIPEFRVKLLALGKDFRVKGRLAVGWIKEKAEAVRSRYWKLMEPLMGVNLGDLESDPFLAFPNLFAFADKVKASLTAMRLNLRDEMSTRFGVRVKDGQSNVEIPCYGGLFTFQYPKGHRGEKLATPLLVQSEPKRNARIGYILRITADLPDDEAFAKAWDILMEHIDIDDPKRFMRDVIHLSEVTFVGTRSVKGQTVPVFEANCKDVLGFFFTLYPEETWEQPEYVRAFIESWGSRTPSLFSDEFHAVLEGCETDKMRARKKELCRRLAVEAEKAEAEIRAAESYVRNEPMNATMEESMRTKKPRT